MNPSHIINSLNRIIKLRICQFFTSSFVLIQNQHIRILKWMSSNIKPNLKLCKQIEAKHTVESNLIGIKTDRINRLPKKLIEYRKVKNMNVWVISRNDSQNNKENFQLMSNILRLCVIMNKLLMQHPKQSIRIIIHTST